MTRDTKPLGRKAYGSIGHLPGSRMGPSDHHCHEGQARIVTEKARDKHDRIFVHEKLDGSCTAVANVDGQIVALGRAGWTAESSPYEQHQLFARWVWDNYACFDILKPGERLVGEWMAQAHGTRYELRDRQPWAVFDLFTDATRRATQAELLERLDYRFATPELIQTGPTSIDEAMTLLDTFGFYGACDPVEGAVWRVERHGEVDFLCKYVRPDKVDGCYLPELTGSEPIWNWRPPVSGVHRNKEGDTEK